MRPGFQKQWESTFLRPGEKQCKFCRASATCPALRAEVMVTVQGAATLPATAEDFDDLSLHQPAAETSADFLANKFLQEGDVVGNWLGFTWIPFEGIDPVSSSTYYTVAWAKSAIHLGDGYVEGRVDRRPDKKNLWQTTINCSMAAGRQDEKGVVEVAYQ